MLPTLRIHMGHTRLPTAVTLFFPRGICVKYPYGLACTAAREEEILRVHGPKPLTRRVPKLRARMIQKHKD